MDARQSDRPEAPTTLRLVHLDRLRILAILDVVTSHATGRHLLLGMGLPVFLLTSVAMSVHRPKPPRVTDFAQRRTRTILVPWVVWSGVYAVGLVLHALRHHQPLTASLEWRMLFYGTALHLWFLPFILAANLAAVWLTGLFGRWPLRKVVAAAMTAGVIVLFVCAWVRIRGPLGPPFLQWLFSIPCIPLGVAVGRAIAMGPHRRPTLVACALLGAAIATVGGVHEPWVLLEWELLRRFGLGVLLVCLAAVPVGRTDPVTNVLIRNTFGIYLVHPLVISLMSQCGLRFDSAWPQALLVYTASLLVAAGLHRTRWAQFV